MLALSLCALIGAVDAGAGGVDVVFVPDAPDAPAVVISVESAGKRRSMAYAVVPPTADVAFSGAASDEGGAPGLVLLPRAPRGAGLVERDGALSFTVDDAGAWEDRYKALPPSKGLAPLPVPGPRGLRVVVHGAVGNGAAPAELHGATLRLTGTAVVRAVAASPVRVVVRAPTGALLEAQGTAVDRVAACGREAPSAVSVVQGDGQGTLALKLFASGAVACAGAIAVVPVQGAKLEAKKDVPVRGVVVAR